MKYFWAGLLGLVLSACSSDPVYSGPFNRAAPLPAYPGATDVSYAENGDDTRVTFFVNASLEDVYAFFHGELTGSGWQRTDLEAEPSEIEADYAQGAQVLEFELEVALDGVFELEVDLGGDNAEYDEDNGSGDEDDDSDDDSSGGDNGDDGSGDGGGGDDNGGDDNGGDDNGGDDNGGDNTNDGGSDDSDDNGGDNPDDGDDRGGGSGDDDGDGGDEDDSGNDDDDSDDEGSDDGDEDEDESGENESGEND